MSSYTHGIIYSAKMTIAAAIIQMNYLLSISSSFIISCLSIDVAERKKKFCVLLVFNLKTAVFQRLHWGSFNALSRNRERKKKRSCWCEIYIYRLKFVTCNLVDRKFKIIVLKNCYHHLVEHVLKCSWTYFVPLINVYISIF